MDIEFSGRIIAATNRRLDEEIVQGGFRQDLFYRINAISLFVPPLRDRKEDIPELVDHLLERNCKALEISKPGVSAAALQLLINHCWKGNVRELKNVLHRCLVFYEPHTIEADHLEFYESHESHESRLPKSESSLAVNDRIHEQVAPSLVENSEQSAGIFVLPAGGVALEDVEKSFLVQALERSRFNQSKACLLLGISRHALRYRLEKFGLLEASQ